MVCFNLYIFNRQGTCVHYHEWYRPKPVAAGAGTVADDQKQIANKSQLGTPRKIGHGCKFHSFRTNTYKLHFMESPSGIKIVLNTSADTGDLRDIINFIYDEIYVEYIVKNPLYTPGEPFAVEQFTQNLNLYLRNMGLLQAM